MSPVSPTGLNEQHDALVLIKDGDPFLHLIYSLIEAGLIKNQAQHFVLAPSFLLCICMKSNLPTVPIRMSSEL